MSPEPSSNYQLCKDTLSLSYTVALNLNTNKLQNPTGTEVSEIACQTVIPRVKTVSKHNN